MKCTIDGCTKRTLARGLCSMHYERWRTKGDPNCLPVKHRNDNGEGSSNAGGYKVHTVNGRKVFAHIAIVERAIGRRLPPGAIVHHADGNAKNNDPSNLVVCPSHAYHNLLHKRMRAMDACGNPNWVACKYCGRYEPPHNMVMRGSAAHHRECHNAYYRNLRRQLTERKAAWATPSQCK